MPFPDSFLLLQQEAYLIRTSVAQGLTLLRSANLGEKGHYYGAFFGLSIGLERLLKVIIILEHMARNDLTPPARKTLRTYGHDLIELFSTALAIPTDKSPHPLAAVAPGSIESDILTQLSDFGEACGRYANLDSLAIGRPQADPLAAWKTIIERILDEDVPNRKKERARRTALALTTAFSDCASVRAHDLDKQPLSLQQWFEVPQLHELAASRAVVHVFRILCPMKELLEIVDLRLMLETQRRGLQEPVAPCVHEFLDFVLRDESVTLRKKRWP
jgi:hypothetical protein